MRDNTAKASSPSDGKKSAGSQKGAPNPRMKDSSRPPFGAAGPQFSTFGRKRLASAASLKRGGTGRAANQVQAATTSERKKAVLILGLDSLVALVSLLFAFLNFQKL